MRAPHFIVNAFTRGPFSGNPAAVCLLDDWPSDSVLAAVAAQNNLSETAFCKAVANGAYELRWFTPTTEIDLCGHATLATAHVLSVENTFGAFDAPSGQILYFETRSGTLSVRTEGDLYALELPSVDAHEQPGSGELTSALRLAGEAEILHAGRTAVVVLDDEGLVDGTAPDFAALAKYDKDLVCVTAPGADCDFVVRVFAPRLGIDEDPATGSAQCALAPYWARRLQREQLVSRQLSKRGAELYARWSEGDDRVCVLGRCVTFVRGEAEIDA